MKQEEKKNKKDKDKFIQTDKRLKRTYGLSYHEWLGKYGTQLGRCAICKQSEEVCGRLCVDHIHQKGYKNMPPEEKRKYVRGLLCYLCNTGIKGFDKTVDGKKNRQRLEGTIEYFKKYPLKGEI